MKPGINRYFLKLLSPHYSPLIAPINIYQFVSVQKLNTVIGQKQKVRQMLGLHTNFSFNAFDSALKQCKGSEMKPDKLIQLGFDLLLILSEEKRNDHAVISDSWVNKVDHLGKWSLQLLEAHHQLQYLQYMGLILSTINLLVQSKQFEKGKYFLESLRGSRQKISFPTGLVKLQAFFQIEFSYAKLFTYQRQFAKATAIMENINCVFKQKFLPIYVIQDDKYQHILNTICRIYVDWAYIQISKGNKQRALQIREEAMPYIEKCAPSNFQVLNSIYILQEYLGNYASAESLISNSINFQKGNGQKARPHLYMKKVELLVKMNKVKEAEKFCHEAIKDIPQHESRMHIELQLSLSNITRSLGKIQCIEHLKNAITIFENSQGMNELIYEYKILPCISVGQLLVRKQVQESNRYFVKAKEAIERNEQLILKLDKKTFYLVSIGIFLTNNSGDIQEKLKLGQEAIRQCTKLIHDETLPKDQRVKLEEELKILQPQIEKIKNAGQDKK